MDTINKVLAKDTNSQWSQYSTRGNTEPAHNTLIYLPSFQTVACQADTSASRPNTKILSRHKYATTATMAILDRKWHGDNGKFFGNFANKERLE